MLLEIAVATKNVTLLETVICKDLVGTGRGAEKEEEEEEGRGGDPLDRLCLFFHHANRKFNSLRVNAFLTLLRNLLGKANLGMVC